MWSIPIYPTPEQARIVQLAGTVELIRIDIGSFMSGIGKTEGFARAEKHTGI